MLYCLTSCCQAGHLALADSYFYAKPCSCNCRCKTKWRLKTISTSTLQSPSCCAPQMFPCPVGPINQGCLLLDCTQLSCIEPNIFSLFLPQTEYAISRVCHCGCHFRTLPQQLPTSTKVYNNIPLLSTVIYWSASCYTYSCLCPSFHQYGL